AWVVKFPEASSSPDVAHREKSPSLALSPHARKGDHAQKRRRISIVTLLEDAWWDNVEGFLPGFRAGCCRLPPSPSFHLPLARDTFHDKPGRPGIFHNPHLSLLIDLRRG
uniref:Uncharacterized protein n=1 Tax=Mus spicilegus TaxID=10103 RepID=A0A8C6I4D4_MUSSI